MVLKSNAEVLVFLCLFIPMVLTILHDATDKLDQKSEVSDSSWPDSNDTNQETAQTDLRPASGETTGTDAGRCCLWIGIRWPRHGPRLQSQHLLGGSDGADGRRRGFFFRDRT